MVKIPKIPTGALDLTACGYTATAVGLLGAGVFGQTIGGPPAGAPGAVAVAAGVHGLDGGGSGVPAPKSAGVYGESDNGNGVYGSSGSWNGVEGDSSSATHAGVAGFNSFIGPGVWGKSNGNAGEFHGDVLCTGNQTVEGTLGVGSGGGINGDLSVGGNVLVQGDVQLVNQDCAEDFDIAEPGVDGGTVVVIGESGSLECCQDAYDKRVAGVISGAGDFRPAIVLGKQESRLSRMPVALLGKVYCKVDAGYSPVGVGDLLTTSPTPGHAMKAADPGRAFGTVIGKALGQLEAGRGLVPILVALQ